MHNVVTGIYFDTRRTNADGGHTIFLRLHRKGANVYIASGFTAKKAEFDGRYFTGRSKDVRVKNDNLHDLYERFQEWCEDFNGCRKSNAEVKEACEMDLFPERVGNTDSKFMLTNLADEYIEKCVHNEGTWACYNRMKNTVKKYGDVDIHRITADWLRTFDNWMEKGDYRQRPLKVNSRSQILRCIRTLINYAIGEEYINKYPFKKFKIRQEATPMRVLTKDEVIMLRDYPLTEYWQRKARDMWMLSFYLLGINNGDLFKLKELVHGRCQYRRGKTHQLFDIAVPDEAMEIIERYRGKDFLLDVCDTNKDYHSYVRNLNMSLKTIGMEIKNGCKHKGKALFPKLSMYYARYSCATLMAELDIPMETVSQCLGHSSGLRVTQIYVKFQQKKIDEAQRKMIDALK